MKVKRLISDEQDGAEHRLSLEVPTRLFDGEKCWAHPRAGIIPLTEKKSNPRVVMTMNTLDLSGSDVFKGMFGMHTDDLGKFWTPPQHLVSLAPRYENIDGVQHPVAASDFWPGYHATTKTLLGTGHTIVYTPEWEIRNPRPRHTAYAIYEPDNNQWSAWKKLIMPDDEKFMSAGAGCVQRYDEADGNILLPIYFKPKQSNSRVTVVRCSFDGKELRHLEHGNELSIQDESRGLHEPSITRFNGVYYLTIRNDNRGYVSISEDGLHYEPIQEWKFDDGSGLGNYNTQQHWVSHSDGLFLLYTRKGANNDHVFRHRAPLFMAQVDPEKLCVIRNTEQVLVPERGARLGNFGVTDVSPDETWVTVAEWMQPQGVEKYGSDGSVYVARIHWKNPNLNFKTG
ncbi:sialidase family protein [Catalinimonas alkaloidigena]|uniref:sialidase family protein n=1 Tax=Catalinimonas alkaloidigena TaxID=1075417 RepID=UPI0024069F87|nr:sialidase family protein [Catalinimonas alkaloidigena]